MIGKCVFLAELSPMMKQYFEIKENNKDAILFFRLGDFYEMFFDDAKLLPKNLNSLLPEEIADRKNAPRCAVFLITAMNPMLPVLSKRVIK